MFKHYNSKDLYQNKSILITGGTGTIGKELTQFLLDNTKCRKICIFSRDEYKQYQMKKKFINHTHCNKLRFLIGDIRDKDRILYACNNIDIVFHAAALKQVDSIEYNPYEAIKTNIIGTQNVIDACIHNITGLLIGISTDKAVAPVNLYGGTKLCLEKLVLLANYNTGNKLKTCILRYGNVIGSRGSVIPLFLKQKNMGEFTVTSLEMTRFTLTMQDACNFIINCAIIAEGGEIFIPKLKKYTLSQLCNVINPKNKIKIIGIRPGEKLHEEMICEPESCYCYESDTFFIIKNINNIGFSRGFKPISKNLMEKFNFKKTRLLSFNSNNVIDAVNKIISFFKKN